jgi:hypothetical protein
MSTQWISLMLCKLNTNFRTIDRVKFNFYDPFSKPPKAFLDSKLVNGSHVVSIEGPLSKPRGILPSLWKKKYLYSLANPEAASGNALAVGFKIAAVGYSTNPQWYDVCKNENSLGRG